MRDLEKKVSRKCVFPANQLDAFDCALFLSSLFDQFERIKLDEITVRQSIIIWKLGSLGEPPSLFKLSNMLFCSHQNLRVILDKLEKLEYVSICDDLEDRRAKKVKLQPKGEQVFEKLSEEKAGFLSTLEKHISKEEAELFCSVSVGIADVLEEVAPEGMDGRWYRQFKKDNQSRFGC